ncbi:MAG TPA: DUF4340 domain-containing protein [Blastocatellia bacterium]|nr:DUF4340 domain-containing protein [Blastocatellia bacterium]HMV86344.1 DUF4340 domain-containing protein [Blastocatellia bacterium]HMZ17570.1 DUF4340 domain-containing protein [Blastocatellia bacterium]HNG31571.1 DUF4340 domain-containing protein [Blastocatellia bacterium]
MKRSTLLLLLAAVVGGVLIYFLEIKPGKPRDEKPDTAKEAFSFKREDITGVTVTRGSEKVVLESQDNKWLVKSPVNAAADDSAMNSLIGDLVSARIEREFPNASADALKEYGLTQPAVKLEVKLKDGKTRTIELGGKDPLGSSVYAKLDGSPNVAVLGASLLTNADKPLNDWRDRSVFGATQYDVTSLKVTNENGSFELGKKDADWSITSPIAGPAEDTEVNSLINEITSAKAAEIVSDTADDLAKYGLDKPKVSATAKLNTGGEKALLVGAKVDDKYYAKTADSGRVLKIESSLYDKLNLKLGTLRSKQFVKLNRDELTRIEVKNASGKLVATKKDDKWLVVEPADKKDKEAQTFKLFTPFESKASEVVDKPTAAMNAKLAKPIAEFRLTDKNGKTTVVKVSDADGDDIYIRVEGRSEVYKLGKAMLEGFNFKIGDAISAN